MKKLIYIVFLVGVIGLSCCTPDPQDTIVFIGSESYVRPMTKLVDSVSWLNAFLSGYDNIPEGYYLNDSNAQTIDKCNIKCKDCNLDSSKNNLCKIYRK